MCEKHKDYVARLAEVGPEQLPHQDVMAHRMDLSKLAFSQQQVLAQELYEYIMPLLHIAAMEGRSFVNIHESKTVKKIQHVSDTFGQLLFHRHNIYKMSVTSADVTIYFLNSTLSHRAERLNDIWEDPLSSTIDEIRRMRRAVRAESRFEESIEDDLPVAPQHHDPHAWQPPVLDP